MKKQILTNEKVKGLISHMEEEINKEFSDDDTLRCHLTINLSRVNNNQRYYEEHFKNFNKYLQEAYHPTLIGPRHSINFEKLDKALERFSSYNINHKDYLNTLKNIGFGVDFLPKELNYMEIQN